MPYAELDLFFISDNVRGTGLGKKIIEKLEDYVQNMGIYKIYLGTAEYYALGFYKKMGYEITETFPKIVDGHNFYNLAKELNVTNSVFDIHDSVDDSKYGDDYVDCIGADSGL